MAEGKPVAADTDPMSRHLSVGKGWTDAVVRLDAIGSPDQIGHDCQAIACWDVVPFQTIDRRFEIGVVAFHIAGIDRVEFSCEGGSWSAIREMSRNPRTGVWEYWTTLDPADARDGPIELRAVVYPKVGQPRVLSDATGKDGGERSLRLFANAQGTLRNSGVAVHVDPAGDDEDGDGSADRPLASILRAVTYLNKTKGGCGGSTIYLHVGEYRYPNIPGDGASDRWVTFTPAAGAKREQVVFLPGEAGVTQRKVHLKNVTLRQDKEDEHVLRLRSGPYGNRFWIDGCEMAGRGYNEPPLSTASFVRGHCYLTDCTIHDTKAPVAGSLCRNVTAYNLGGDFCNGRGGLYVDMKVTHMRRATGVHPDVWQIFSGEVENLIVYGMDARDIVGQGINIGQGGKKTENVALVNCLIEQVPGDASRNFLPAAASGRCNHVLLWHHTYVNMKSVDSYGGQRNLDIVGCVFDGFSPSQTADTSGWRVRHNHFASPKNVRGADSTAGLADWTREAQWQDRTQRQRGDYRPAAASPLLDRVSPSVVPCDLAGKQRPSASSVGAFEGGGD
jgi:hypothetical protein